VVPPLDPKPNLNGCGVSLSQAEKATNLRLTLFVPLHPVQLTPQYVGGQCQFTAGDNGFVIVERITGPGVAAFYADQRANELDIARLNGSTSSVQEPAGLGDRSILVQYLLGIGGGQTVGGHTADMLALQGNTFVTVSVHQVDIARSAYAARALAALELPKRSP
jgi:hypothetical protein